ncbi:hypothetical protein FALBO_17187, partial [Fusarium albosuccineum]
MDSSSVLTRPHRFACLIPHFDAASFANLALRKRSPSSYKTPSALVPAGVNRLGALEYSDSADLRLSVHSTDDCHSTMPRSVLNIVCYFSAASSMGQSACRSSGGPRSADVGLVARERCTCSLHSLPGAALHSNTLPLHSTYTGQRTNRTGDRGIAADEAGEEGVKWQGASLPAGLRLNASSATPCLQSRWPAIVNLLPHATKKPPLAHVTTSHLRLEQLVPNRPWGGQLASLRASSTFLQKPHDHNYWQVTSESLPSPSAFANLPRADRSFPGHSRVRLVDRYLRYTLRRLGQLPAAL